MSRRGWSGRRSGSARTFLRLRLSYRSRRRGAAGGAHWPRLADGGVFSSCPASLLRRPRPRPPACLLARASRALRSSLTDVSIGNQHRTPERWKTGGRGTRTWAEEARHTGHARTSPLHSSKAAVACHLLQDVLADATSPTPPQNRHSGARSSLPLSPSWSEPAPHVFGNGDCSLFASIIIPPYPTNSALPLQQLPKSNQLSLVSQWEECRGETFLSIGLFFQFSLPFKWLFFFFLSSLV